MEQTLFFPPPLTLGLFTEKTVHSDLWATQMLYAIYFFHKGPPQNLSGAWSREALYTLKTAGLNHVTSHPYFSMVKSTKQHGHTAAGSGQYS